MIIKPAGIYVYITALPLCLGISNKNHTKITLNNFFFISSFTLPSQVYISIYNQSHPKKYNKV